MKLKLETNHMLVGGTFTESDFSVGDPRIIIHHLVKSVYSNPKVTMVQEIACNARDSHVENGNENKPIHIKLPTAFDPELAIRDFGPGISPERMHDVFIKIGNSTKRNDNLSDGSFGIGAKIPLSYTDQFTIRTIVNENGHLTLRVYTCVRRDDYSLKLMELGEPHLINSTDPAEDQHTGTTIIIPILKDDFTAIRQAVLSKTEFWKIRPVLSGGTAEEMTYPKREWFYQCDDFMFSMNDGRCYNANNVHAVVNGVYYPIKSRPQHGYYGGSEDDAVVVPNFGGAIYLNFKIGEVKPSLSREALHYDEATKAMIVKKVTEAIAVIKTKVRAIINDAKSYLDGAETAARFVNNGWLDNIEHATWKGITFKRTICCTTEDRIDENGNTFKVHNDTVHFTTFRLRNGKVKERTEDRGDIFLFTDLLRKETTIFCTERKRICYNSIKHYINTVGIKGENRICFLGSKATVTEWLTKRHMGELAVNIVDLKDSGYVAPKRGSGGGYGRIINKWDVTYSSSGSIVPNGTFDPTDPKDTGYYYIYDREEGADRLNIGGKTLATSSDLRCLLRLLGLNNVFGISPGNVKYISKTKWKPFREFFDDPTNAETLKILAQWRTYLLRKNTDSDNPFIMNGLTLLNLSEISTESPVHKWINAVKALGPNTKPPSRSSNYDYDSERAVGFAVRAKIVPKTDSVFNTITDLHTEAMTKYPMLALLDKSKSYAAVAAAVETYIKMVDAQKTT